MKFRRLGSSVFIGADDHIMEICCESETEAVTLLYNLYRRARQVHIEHGAEIPGREFGAVEYGEHIHSWASKCAD